MRMRALHPLQQDDLGVQPPSEFAGAMPLKLSNISALGVAERGLKQLENNPHFN